MKRKLLGVTAIILVMAIFSSSVFSVFAQASEIDALKTEVIDKSTKQLELQNNSLLNDMEGKLNKLYKYLSIDEKGMAILNPTPEIKNLFTNEDYKKITDNIERTNKIAEKGIAYRQSNGDLEVTVESLSQYIIVDEKGIQTLNLTPEIRNLLNNEEYNEIKSNIESNKKADQKSTNQQAIVKIKAIELSSSADPDKKEEASVENPIEELKDGGIEVKYHAFYVDLKMSKAKAEQVADIMNNVATFAFVFGSIPGLISLLGGSEKAGIYDSKHADSKLKMGTIIKIIGVINFILGLFCGQYLNIIAGTLRKKIARGKHGAILRIYYIPYMTTRSW